MKKFFSLVCAGILILSIAACSPAVSSQTGVGATTSSNNGSYLSTSFTDASPVQIQLAVGTLQLEGSGDAVDAQTAADLLPLWQAVSSLGNSDTTSAVEIQAIYEQIQETMSAAQVKAIANMQITSQMAAQYVLEAGLASQVSAPAGDQVALQESGAPSTSQSAGMPAGDPGIGVPPDGMGPGMESQGSQASVSGQPGGFQGTGIQGVLVQAVIGLLHAKAA